MKTSLPSNRKFGMLIALVFFVLSAYSFFVTALSLSALSYFLVGFVFFIAGIFNLELLTPINKAWFLLGQTMGKVVSPIVLGIIFFVLITPIGLIAKLLGRDELKLNRPKCQTYWVDPVGSNSDSESFKNQF